MFFALVDIYAGYVYNPGIFGALGLQCALGQWPGGKCGLAFGVGVVIGGSLTTLQPRSKGATGPGYRWWPSHSIRDAS